MSEEPKIPQVPEPGDKTSPEESPLGNKPGENASLTPLSTNAHRVTGDLESPHVEPNQSEGSDSLQPKAPVSDDLLPDQPPALIPPKSGQPRRTESLMRRLTGSIGRSTGPLGRTGPAPASSADLPAKDVDGAFGAEPPAAASSVERTAAPLGSEQASAEPAGPEPQGFVRRITGSLRRITGPLRDTAPLPSSRQGQVAAVEEKSSSVEVGREGPPKAGSGELVEKRKRSTGPLGSMLSGILRGGPAESEPAQQPKPDDYVSEIRQNLASEEVLEANKPKGSGFLQMITGGFRRMTGSLGRTSDITPPRVEKTEPVVPELATSLDLEPSGLEIEAEIEEVLLEDRLAGTAVSESAIWAEPEDIVIELGAPEPGSFDLEEPVLAESLPEPGGAEPITLLESGAIAALDQAEKESKQEEAPSGWMAEIRQEAVEAEKSTEGTEEKPRGITSPLRDFIAGILRPEEKQLPSADAEVPDELVTGRLGLDQAPGTVIEEAALTIPAVEEGSAEAILPVTDDLEAAAATAVEEAAQVEDTSFLERLQAQGTGTLELPKMQEDTGAVFTLSPEDERLLWGAPPEAPRTIRAEEYWDPLQISQQASELPPDLPAESETYAAGLLPGAQTAPFQGETRPLKRRTTGRLKREAERKPFEDIRSVLMDDYRAAEQQRLGKAAAPAAAVGGFVGAAASSAVTGEDYEPGPFETEPLAASRAKSLGEWLGTRTTLQKIILVELALVVLALLTAVPFFTYMLLRGPKIAVTPQTQLPADIPYPTGLTLPGGWQFQLGRNTMVDGVWKPTQSEWLEGTELRRVVALPWSRQTEAVVRSFQEGDQIELKLSNSDILPYTVERIGQVSIDDSSVYSGTSPSLIIILFDEEESALERWVVFCKR